MKSIEILNEVKPKFPPKVQAIWDDCGTYIESINAVVAAGELEFFVEKLVENLVEDYLNSDSFDLIDVLQRNGYYE